MRREKGSAKLPCCLDDDRVGQLLVKVVPRVLDGDNTASLNVRNHRDFLTAVAAQREQKAFISSSSVSIWRMTLFLALYCIC